MKTVSKEEMVPIGTNPKRILTKEEFKSLRVQDVVILVAKISTTVLSHTSYTVEIALNGTHFYEKTTRFT